MYPSQPILFNGLALTVSSFCGLNWGWQPSVFEGYNGRPDFQSPVYGIIRGDLLSEHSADADEIDPEVSLSQVGRWTSLDLLVSVTILLELPLYWLGKLSESNRPPECV